MLLRKGTAMQTRSPIFDDIAQLLTTAAGAAQGVREEVETLVRAQVERAADGLDLVSREDFEAVREMAIRALDRLDAVESELTSLKKELGRAPAKKSASKKAAKAKAKTKAQAKMAHKSKR